MAKILLDKPFLKLELTDDEKLAFECAPAKLTGQFDGLALIGLQQVDADKVAEVIAGAVSIYQLLKAKFAAAPAASAPAAV